MEVNKIIFGFVRFSFSILIILLIVVGLVKMGNFCYDFGYRVFTETAVEKKPGKDVVVNVTKDMSESQIGYMLEEKGLVREGMLFYAQLKLSAYSGKLRPGTYTLNTSMIAKDMMVVMSAAQEEEEATSSQ